MPIFLFEINPSLWSVIVLIEIEKEFAESIDVSERHCPRTVILEFDVCLQMMNNLRDSLYFVSQHINLFQFLWVFVNPQFYQRK